MKEKPIFDCEVKLERFQAKGGWTYAPLPGIQAGKTKRFGWLKVKGRIDGFSFEQCHLMPMGNGTLFLPVKAEIRKKIGKREGDMVKVVLFRDDSAFTTPEEFEACLKDEPAAFTVFQSLKNWEKKMIIKNIYSAKQETTKTARMAKIINALAKGKHPFQ